MKVATYSLINGSKAMIFGAITNSWKEHLAGHDLPSLVRAAVAKGTSHMVKIVHIKQVRDGHAHPIVDTWDLDCARLLRVLEAKNYGGPVIMEIPPDPQVFDNLSASFAYLRAASGQS